MSHRRRLTALLLAGIASVSLFSRASRAQTGAAGGSSHTLLLIGGDVWTAGSNYFGQIGVGGGPDRYYRTLVAQGVTAVATGVEHSLALKSDGTVLAWGHGNYGALGILPPAHRNVPSTVPVSGIIAIGASLHRSYVVTSGGNVFMFGGGYLGNGSGVQYVNEPTQVPGLTGATAVAVGSSHVLVLKDDGTVVAWGDNSSGELGDGTTTAHYSPQPVPGLTDIVQIAAGNHHSVALNSSGQVYAWGYNTLGSVGDGTLTNRLSPVLLTSLNGITITKISTGWRHTLALASDGTVRGWGDNNSGQIDNSTASRRESPTLLAFTDIANVAATTEGGFAFTADGRLFGWGNNNDGKLGDGTTSIRRTPILLAEGGGFLVGTPVFSGTFPGNNYNSPRTVGIASATPGATVRYTTNGATPTETDLVVPGGGVYVDRNMTLSARAFLTGNPPSLVTSGVYTFKPDIPSAKPGEGKYTSPQTVELSTGSPGIDLRYTLDGSEPSIASPLYTTPLLISTGLTLKVKGFRDGWTPSDTRTVNYTFNFGTLAAPTMTPAGGTFTSDQTVTLTAMSGAQIRYSTTGNPGPGSTLYTAPIVINANTTLRAAAFHSDWTQSGITTGEFTMNVAPPTFSAASGAHTPGELVTVTSATPGATIRYTLNGSTPTATSPIIASGTSLTIGNYPLKAFATKTGYATSSIAAATYSLSGDLTPPRIAAGHYHSTAVRTDGTVWATGRNASGTLGDNTTTPQITPVIAFITGVKSLSASESHTLAVTLGGHVYAWGSNAAGQLGDGTTNGQRNIPGLVSGLTDVVAVAAGTGHSLALTSAGQVWAWGRNINGQIGDGGTSARLTPYQVPGLPVIAGIAAGESHSVAWTSTGSVWVWGANGVGQLGDGSQNERRNPTLLTNISGVAAVAAGRQHTLAVTTSNALYAWGLNGSGQVGDNSTTMRTAPVLISTLSGVARVSAGYSHSLAVTQAGAVYAWGGNGGYQIGDNTTTNRLVPTALPNLPIMADVSAGHSHSMALGSDGSVWTWGTNTQGQIGNGTTTVQTTPTPISDGGLSWGVSRPTFAPAPGTFTSAQQVTLATPTPGATIRYTLDGTAPTASSNLYTAPISIDTGTAISAKAFKAGLADSAVATGVYTFDYGTLATPTASPAAGTYPPGVEITLSGPAGATLRYTTDNTAPTASSTIYSAPLTITSTTTLQARAFKTDWAPSAPLVAAYTISTNQSPAAGPDTITTKEDTQVLVPVLANDTDPDNDTLTITSVTQGTKGSVSIGPGSGVTYTPTANSNGADSFTYTISDGNNHTAVASVAVNITAVNDAPIVTVQATPNDGEAPVNVQFLADASDADSPTLTYAWNFGDGQTATTAASVTHLYAAAGTYVARLTVSDGTASASVTSIVSVRPVGGGEAPPPNPTATATPTNPGVTTNFGEATEFLYSGAAPVQRGVTSGTIDPARVAVVRGRVFDQAGTPLPGARVEIAGQDDFGYTFSRADGMFDMAVNGGGVVVVRLTKDGYLSSQRRVDTRWQDYSWMDNVRLVPLDPVVSTVGFHASAPEESRYARGSAVTDVDGTRQPTLIVPDGGSNATIHNSDGTVSPAMSQLHIRATEYTVGTSSTGREAMPGDLPPTSAYTYAVELTADEAIEADAVNVTFSPALAFYLENFLNFPVGKPVPVGYYDRNKALWVPSDNGLIVKVLAIDPVTELADLDIDGSGTAATPAALAALGVTEGERKRVGSLYAEGQTLWRVPIAHFTPYDCNWPYGPPSNAQESNLPDPVGDPTKPKKCGTAEGSIIECETQGLGERLGISGTPYTLNYLSIRQPGHAAGGLLDIALSGASLSPSLKRIDVTVDVAGKRVKQEIANPQPNMSLPFAWDGKDAYGRPVYGTHRATVKVDHVYDAVYYEPGEAFDRAFGLAGQNEITGSRARSEVMLGQTFDKELSFEPPATSGLGGWTLNVHHVYDPMARLLARGDGGEETRDFKALSATTLAGGGSTVPTTSGTPANQANLQGNDALAIGPDGSIVMSSSPEFYRLDADNVVRRLPDLPAVYPYGAGNQIAIDPQNRLLVGVPANVVEGAGGCTEGGYSDGVSLWMLDGNTWSEVATAPTPDHVAACGHPLVAIGADGTIYLTQGPYLYQYRPGDMAPALIATVATGQHAEITGIAVSADGAVYVGTVGFIDKIAASGARTRVAGTGMIGYSGDNGPATAAEIQYARSLQVDTDGTLYLLDVGSTTNGARGVRKITPQGVISTIVGGGDPNDPTNHADGVPMLSVNIDFRAITLGSDGISAFDSGAGYKLRKLNKDAGVATLSSALSVVSTDGSEVYVFDRGRHMQTRQALTNIVLRTFEYDSEKRLTGIVDGHGNRTTIERDANGAPLRIIAPFGQETTLTLDQDGMLSGVTDPAGKTTQLAYQAGGLLTTFTTPESHTSTFSYDTQGRLVSDQSPGGGIQTLTRTTVPNGWAVSLAHNAGYAHQWITERPDTGEEITRTIKPGVAMPMVSTTYPDGRTEIVYPEGMQTTVLSEPDPRFGAQVSFKSSVTTSTPSGLTATTTRTRTAVLAEPGNPLSVQMFTIEAATNGRMRSTVYNAAARTLTSTSPLGRQTITTFDTAGQPVRIEQPGLHPIIQSYNSLGQLTGITTGTRTSTLTYDSGGRLASMSHPHGGATTYSYDAAGRLTSMAMGGGRTISFSFDDDGKMIRLTPPGRPDHTVTFTPAGRLASYTAPGGGTFTATYRIDKQIEMITRPGESAITVGYDAAGRAEQVATPTGTISTAYDASTGLVSGITSPDAGLSFSYDGALPLGEEWSGTVSGNVSWTWDNNFRATSQSVNGANPVPLVYDLDGLITSVGELTLTRQPQTGFVTGATIGLLADEIILDAYGEMQSYSTKYDATPLAAFSYVRDALGRIAQSTEVIDGVTHTLGYAYDPAGRLHQVTRDGTLIATYQYDQNGNRHTTITSSGQISATFDDRDRLVTAAGATYTYTGSGYLQTRTDGASATSYAYDAFGNLRSVTLPSGQVVSYLVDGKHRRIARLVDGTRTHAWLYDGKLHPVAELDAFNAVTTRYVYGTRPNVPDYMVRAGATYRFITDARGSVRLVVNANTGAIAQRLDYDAWGEVSADSNPGFQPFGFAGGLYDQQTRLHRFGARDYEGATGRWLAIDPGAFTGGSNLYAYAHGDPINFIDPSGDVPVLAPAIIGGLLGLGTNVYWQLLVEGKSLKCFDLSDALVAGAFGAFGGMLGAAIPMSAPQAMMWGAGLNVDQYLWSQALNGQQSTWQGVGWNAATGAAGGFISSGAEAVLDSARRAALDQMARTGRNDIAVAGETVFKDVASTYSAAISNAPQPKTECPSANATCP